MKKFIVGSFVISCYAVSVICVVCMVASFQTLFQFGFKGFNLFCTFFLFVIAMALLTIADCIIHPCKSNGGDQ